MIDKGKGIGGRSSRGDRSDCGYRGGPGDGNDGNGHGHKEYSNCKRRRAENTRLREEKKRLKENIKYLAKQNIILLLENRELRMRIMSELPSTSNPR